jgi:glycosyltransferase involved in cell wall biosynthesis
MGGVETHCEQLSPLLKRMRPQDSFVIIGRRRYLPDRQSQYMGLKVVALAHAKGRRLEAITNAFFGILYAKFVVKADLVHVQGIGPAIALPLAKLLGLKIIVTHHTKNYEQAKWGWVARAFLRLGELFALWLSDYVITVSNVLRSDLNGRFPGKSHKINFIPNGANHLQSAGTPGACAATLDRFELKQRAYIIAVGRLVPEKGFHDLIDAFRMAAVRDHKLVIVGDADHADEYSRRLRARAAKNVVFTGFLRGEAVQILLRNASLFVLPSSCEGMPIAALEAIIGGCPVLLSDIEPNRALGLASRNYFPVGSVNSLRDKLEGDHASYCVDRSAFLAIYNWESVCARTNGLYSAVERNLRSRHTAGGSQRSWLGAFGPRS